MGWWMYISIYCVPAPLPDLWATSNMSARAPKEPRDLPFHHSGRDHCRFGNGLGPRVQHFATIGKCLRQEYSGLPSHTYTAALGFCSPQYSCYCCLCALLSLVDLVLAAFTLSSTTLICVSNLTPRYALPSQVKFRTPRKHRQGTSVTTSKVEDFRALIKR